MTGPAMASTARTARAARVLACVLLLSGAAGCADRTERYCTELEEQQPVLEELARGPGSGGTEGEDPLGRTVEVLRTLQQEAPSDVADEWTTVLFAYEGVADAFEAAGADPGSYDPQRPGPGVSEAEADRIRDAASELLSARVLRAADEVEQHAVQVCEVDLGLGSSG